MDINSKSWHKTVAYKSMSVSFFQGILNILLLVFVGILLLVEKEPKSFAVTTDFRVIEALPVNEANITDTGVLQWSADATAEAFSFNFNEFGRQLSAVQENFTGPGFDAYLNQLTAEGWIAKLKNREINTSCIVTGVPIVQHRGVNAKKGKFVWQVVLPIRLAIYSTAGTNVDKKMTVRLTIERCSLRENPRGVQIANFQII